MLDTCQGQVPGMVALGWEFDCQTSVNNKESSSGLAFKMITVAICFPDALIHVPDLQSLLLRSMEPNHTHTWLIMQVNYIFPAGFTAQPLVHNIYTSFNIYLFMSKTLHIGFVGTDCLWGGSGRTIIHNGRFIIQP